MKALMLPLLEGLLAVLQLLPQKQEVAPEPEPEPIPKWEPPKQFRPDAMTRHLEKHKRIIEANDRLQK